MIIIITIIESTLAHHCYYPTIIPCHLNVLRYIVKPINSHAL